MKILTKNCRGGVCLLLILLLSIVSSGIALANESSVQAYMSLAATSLDITISESISMNSDGTTENLMVSDLVVKSNMDLGVVNVTDISVNAENGWTLVKKGTDFISMNADSQQIYLGYSTHDFSKGALKINDFEVAPGESKALSLSAKTGPIKTDISNQKVATVILTAELDHITWVDLGENLGEVAVENGDDLTFEVNEETGTILGSTKEPLETIPPVLPDEAIPTLIEFNGGYFDLKSNYVSSRYETVTYTKTETAPKEPVTYDWGLICSWHFDENYNIYPGNSSLQDVDFDSTYIVYVKYDAVSADGVPTSGLEYYSIKNENDDTLENAVYLAAYLIKTGKSSDFDIAMWDGTEYVDLNKQDEIAAVDTFTYSYEVTAEKTVQVSNPSSSTEHVYIPTETMQAEENMTWEEWLSSSYNLTGLTGSEAGFVLKDSDYNDVALTSEIAADGSYAMYIANLDPGLYDAEGTMLASWDTLVNDYGMDVEKDYSNQSTFSNYYQNVTSSPYNVLKNFSGATKLVMGKGIKKIGSVAFYCQNELEVIEIPEGVTTIGYEAFSQSGLKSVSIPEGVTTIGENAFEYCDITTIKISDSVTTIGVNAFHSNNLTTIKIPSSVTSIGAAAFGANINLTSITVSGTNPAYSSENGILFNKDKTTLILYPTGRTGSYTIPNTVTSIENDAFYYCAGLTAIEIPDSVNSIGASAFYNCSNLVSVKIPDGITSIESDTFNGCRSLTAVELPDTITTIKADAFYDCDSLASIKIPVSVTEIGSKAFLGCDSLATIEIPSSVVQIQDGAFGCNRSLTAITVNNANPAYCSEDGILFSKDKQILMSYPPAASAGSLTVPDGVTTIAGYAFASSENLTSLTIPESVSSIGGNAFAGCSNLETITYKGTVEQWKNIELGKLWNSQTPAKNVICTDGSVDISGCFAEGTLISLADGTEKAIEKITYEDELLAWDLNTGSYAVTTPSLIESHEKQEKKVINLKFEDGTLVRIIEDHGFFDASENTFVFLDEANVDSYIGHKFVKAGEGGSNEVVKLTGYHVTTEKVSYYTIQTAVYNNCVAEGMLTLTSPPEGFDGWFDYFTIGEGMKYDEAMKQADIEKYGLYSYEDFAEYVTYEQFLAFNGPYLKILVGRGVLTYDDILSIIAEYLS